MGGKMGDIYAIKRLDIDKIVYIGQTIRNYKIRWQQHKQVAKNADSSRYALYAAIQKLGVDNFYPLLIENCDNSLLNEREQYWIKYYNTKENGYNCNDGGDAATYGENNGRSKLTEQDVIEIRKAYNNHLKQKDVYKKYEDKITFGYFQNL